MNRRLPIICPKCLSRQVETALDDRLSCPRCASRFPVVAGFPILLADETVRAQLASGTALDASRVAFYQNDETYLPNSDALSQPLLPSALALAAQWSGTGGRLRQGSVQKYRTRLRGLDLSLTALRRNLAGHAGLCASAEMIPLASASCRFVISVQTLEHIPSTDRAFEEIDRVLAPGGVAYLAPAWHCRPWIADGIPVRPYRDLKWKQRLVKLAIPIGESAIFRGAASVPWRVWRRLTQPAARPSTIQENSSELPTLLDVRFRCLRFDRLTRGDTVL